MDDSSLWFASEQNTVPTSDTPPSAVSSVMLCTSRALRLSTDSAAAGVGSPPLRRLFFGTLLRRLTRRLSGTSFPSCEELPFLTFFFLSFSGRLRYGPFFTWDDRTELVMELVSVRGLVVPKLSLKVRRWKLPSPSSSQPISGKLSCRQSFRPNTSSNTDWSSNTLIHVSVIVSTLRGKLLSIFDVVCFFRTSDRCVTSASVCRSEKLKMSPSERSGKEVTSPSDSTSDE
mmetsp:Transcript_3516/g.9535  ORF Transcript_3516/g.9535 Transcript_3516/m.9535 type:complete len:230 (-) Transcript_3516:114-803(-)